MFLKVSVYLCYDILTSAVCRGFVSFWAPLLTAGRRGRAEGETVGEGQ